MLRVTLLVAFASMFFFSRLMAQEEDVLNTKISINLQNVTLKRALKELDKHSGFSFSYSESILPLGNKLSLSREEQSLRSVLSTLLNNTEIIYRVYGNQIVLVKAQNEQRATANQSITISGYISDMESGEALLGATVYLPEQNLGVSANVYGFYSLTIKPGKYSLQFASLGYKSEQHHITADQNTVLNITLGADTYQLKEIIVRSSDGNVHVADEEMSAEQLSIEEVKSSPALLGEADVMRTVQFLPGVQTVSEGSTGLYVRGGTWDQTLVQLDEAMIFNPSHLGGLMSIFNPDAVKGLKIYKGNMPANFGGRLSSVLDVRMKDGNNQKFSGSGGIGTLASRLTLEGPLVKNRSSFIVSARRSYLDLLLQLSDDPDVKGNKVFFYDLNTKLNFTFNEKNKIFLSGYFGRDRLKLDKTFGVNWGNATGTFRWNHVFNKRLFLNTTMLYSNFDLNYLLNDGGSNNLQWKSKLRSTAVKFDFNHYLNNRRIVDFGYHIIYHHFLPITVTPINERSIIQPFSLEQNDAIEQALYLDSDHTISDKLSLTYGLRLTRFQNVGPGEILQYEKDQPKTLLNVVDTLNYDKLETIKAFHGIEPRIGLRWLWNAKTSIKASYNRTKQYIHVLSSAATGLPNDRWMPSGPHIKPQVSDQVAMGYFRNFMDNAIESSVEAYYKWMSNQVDFSPETDVLLSRYPEIGLLSGKAWSYGLEFAIHKRTGRTTGRINYTWSKAFRRIDGINGGRKYHPIYDRRHDASLVVSHKLSKRVSISANWIFASGRAISLPVGKYEIGGEVVVQYDPFNRNTDRLPDYHRLDLALELRGKNKKNKKWNGHWNFSLYNAYFRKNPLGVRFRNVINNDLNISEDDPNVKVETKEFKGVFVSLFHFVPSVSYSFKF
ncbi:TonB-dependent receptor [Fulvivirgaceae bacterium BMA10]|uniref:TonB-dependent receptor n=1 Tax=Splendidivirga corallicola TaxID=3051826 RepID=A0ABT8KTY3_9BACT|nr:TonB-dependent receptor [Fulvivirgaceae bacterium BMA10]